MSEDVSFPLFGRGSTAAITDRLRLRLLSLSGTTINPNWNSHDFTAPYWRLYLNLDDGAVAYQGGRLVPFAAGHLFVIPAWLSWAGRCSGQVRHVNAAFDLPSLPRERVVKTCDRVVLLGKPGSRQIDHWLRLAHELARAERIDAAQVAHGYALVYEALAGFFASLAPRADHLLGESADDRLATVAAFVELHLSEPLPLDGLAKVARCSVAELVRRFRGHCGTSPARWVRQRRVTAAADLLRCSSLSLDDIAIRCGFGDRTRLSRTFTSLIGLGPAAWRRREWQRSS